MLNKLITLIIRAVAVYFIAFGIALSIGEVFLKEIPNHNDYFVALLFFLWGIGGIYSLLKFNQPYHFISVEIVGDKILDTIDDKQKYKIEEDMLRLKKLYDEDILTDNEYKIKLQVLKERYL